PPLRARKGDIPLLARRFLDKYAKPETGAGWDLSPECLEVLHGYRWPGNVRELENLIRQILVFAAPGHIGVDFLPARFRARNAVPPPRSFREAKAQALASFERDYASHLLLTCAGNVSRAARAARQDRRAFGRLLKKYGIRNAQRDETHFS